MGSVQVRSLRYWVECQLCGAVKELDQHAASVSFQLPGNVLYRWNAAPLPHPGYHLGNIRHGK